MLARFSLRIYGHDIILMDHSMLSVGVSWILGIEAGSRARNLQHHEEN